MSLAPGTLGWCARLDGHAERPTPYDCGRSRRHPDARAGRLEAGSRLAARSEGPHNRILRVAIIAIRGIWAHRIGLQAAALTYYTVFSLVPLLVVALWILKAFGRLPGGTPAMPVATEMTKGNTALHSVFGKLVENLSHASQVTSGVLGLVVLLYTVVRLFMRTERALDVIALSTTRKPQFFRLFGYLALLLLSPLLGLVAGAIAGVSHSTIGSKISGLFGSAARLKLSVAAAFGLSGIWLAIAIFYSAAARARIAFSSAAVGAAVATVLLLCGVVGLR